MLRKPDLLEGLSLATCGFNQKSSFLQETLLSAPLPLPSTGAENDRVISEGKFAWVSRGSVSLAAALLPVQLPPGVLQQPGLRCAGGPETRSAQCPDHFGY